MDADAMTQHDDDSDRDLVRRALDGRLTSAYQPIVALDRNVVVGYEALLRAEPSLGVASADFSAAAFLDTARRVGLGYEAEAAALRTAFTARDDLPVTCFLSLNLSVGSLTDSRVTDVLLQQGSLDGVVLEVNAHEYDVMGDVHDSIVLCKDRGALIAIADPFLHPDWLERMMLLEPGFLKLDRSLIDGVSVSNTKLALVDSVRHLAERLSVGVIAQGIEELADLRSLERIGIGFGQGYLLAPPSTTRHFTSPLPLMRSTDERGTKVKPLRALIEAVCELTEDDLDLVLPTSGSGIEFEVLVTEVREPMALLQRVGRRIESLSLTLVDEGASLQAAARVAMRRGTLTRFHPLVCVDELGACVGVIRIDRLIDAMAAEVNNANGEPRPSARTGLSNAGQTGHRSRFAFDFSCRPPRRR